MRVPIFNKNYSVPVLVEREILTKFLNFIDQVLGLNSLTWFFTRLASEPENIHARGLYHTPLSTISDFFDNFVALILNHHKYITLWGVVVFDSEQFDIYSFSLLIDL